MSHRPGWRDFAPGDERNEPIAARPFNWLLIIGLFALQLAAIGAFVWWLA